MKSDVYFLKTEAADIQRRILALKKLLLSLKPFSGYKKNEFVPVKLTIGDASCVYHLNPELVKLVIAEIKNKGAKPFLFDTSVIYNGERQNAIDHLNLAQSKGFAHSQVGAPFIIADGIFGQDGREYIIAAMDINRVKLPSFIEMVDNLVVLSHVTGHIFSCYAGAIKNVAMGMSCRASKQVMHSSLKPSVIVKKCTACGCCIAICPVGAIAYVNPALLGKIKGRVKEKAQINSSICIGCGDCLCVCKFDAICINWQEEPQVFCRRMAAVAHFVLSKFRRKFFINFAFDVTKECDCISDKDEKMVSENLGILASTDILGLEKATTDLLRANKADFFTKKSENYEAMLAYGYDIGLGNLEYNLIQL